jgi:hypothetical protein
MKAWPFLPMLVVCVAAGAAALSQAGAAAAADDPQWTSREISDSDFGGTYIELNLAGTYVTPPSVANAEPALVVDCANHKVLKNYFAFGAVLSQHVGGLHRVELEAYDDDVRRPIIVDELSPDGTSANFSRLELKRMLAAHKVTVRAIELGGPPFLASFIMPDSTPVFSACGQDFILKRK